MYNLLTYSFFEKIDTSFKYTKDVFNDKKCY